MSEIMGLRTQILDNVQLRHPHFDRDTRFALFYYERNQLEPWCVSLEVPREAADQNGNGRCLEGTGGTPEAAYRDLLMVTAVDLAENGV